MSDRPLLTSDHVAPAARQAMALFHADTVREVREAVQRHPVVVIGMAQNPFCKEVRKSLDAAGVAYHYLEYGSYLSKWKPRLAIKLWSGWPTFPQVFVRGTLVGGALDVKHALADGSLRQRLGTDS